jgi:hypothetical protein
MAEVLIIMAPLPIITAMAARSPFIMVPDIIRGTAAITGEGTIVGGIIAVDITIMAVPTRIIEPADELPSWQRSPKKKMQMVPLRSWTVLRPRQPELHATL